MGTIALHQAAADWSGSGEFSCYGHVSTDVSSPEGGDHLGEGTLNCNIIEWGGGPLGPEAMFFKPNGGAEFEIWAWDYHDWDSEHWPMPYATCEGQIWVSSPNCNLKTVGLIGSGAEVCTSAPPKHPLYGGSIYWPAAQFFGRPTVFNNVHSLV